MDAALMAGLLLTAGMLLMLAVASWQEKRDKKTGSGRY